MEILENLTNESILFCFYSFYHNFSYENGHMSEDQLKIFFSNFFKSPNYKELLEDRIENNTKRLNKKIIAIMKKLTRTERGTMVKDLILANKKEEFLLRTYIQFIELLKKACKNFIRYKKDKFNSNQPIMLKIQLKYKSKPDILICQQGQLKMIDGETNKETFLYTTNQTKKYDKLFSNKGSNENILYDIEIKNNELEAIKNIVNIYKERHIEREKNPGTFGEYWNDYNIGTGIFSPERYKDKTKKFILEEYLPLAKEIITSKNEILYEKIRHIKLLTHLLMVENNKEIKNEIYSMIHSSIEMHILNQTFTFDNIHYKNKNDLVVNVMMCDVILNKLEYDDVLNKYIEIAINNEENIEEILTCVKIINDYLRNKSKSIIEKQYILFNLCYNVDDVDIRNKTVIMSEIFIGVDNYQKKIFDILNQRIQDIIVEECKGYFNLIRKQENKEPFNEMINGLKNNRNYYIRYISNKYL